MTIDGFTYVRNGIKMGYPFIPSIQSLLPLVNKLYVVVGDSDDGTREAIEALQNSKIVIIDTTWDETRRENGTIFKEQANIGLKACTADWCFHIQADEVLKEDAYPNILKQITRANQHNDIDGLLFPYYHFWGDYQHIRNTRGTHAYEIRAFKNHRQVFSYKDSQGFRKVTEDNPSSKEKKLNVLKIKTPIFHYSYTRNPKLMNKKSNYFHKFWHDDKWIEKNTNQLDFDFNAVDQLELFEGSHPSYMDTFISKKDWEFQYDPSKSTMRLKHRFLYIIEKLFNYRLFEYRNYKIKRLKD